MNDNRWCDWCGSDRTTTTISWYLVDENEEMSFCDAHVNEVRASDIYDTVTLITR